MSRVTFEDFAAKEDWPRSAWTVEPGPLALYVRRALHPDVDFDLANMNAKTPGKGALTAFLDKYEPHYVFRIENILNKRLVPFFLKRGYTIVPNPHDPENAYPCLIGPRR